PPSVRAHLSRIQRELVSEMGATHGGAVVEGRDIGAVIVPDARLKIWLTASPEARGRRRAVELAEGAVPGTAVVDGSVEQLARRDGLDSSRRASPLHQAQDAHAIDTTPYTAQQVIDLVLELWHTVKLPADDRREAVVEDVPGVTRDRVAYDANWRGRRFIVVDTGGWEPDAVGLQARVAAQAEYAVTAADAVLLVVDATVGATDTDEAVARVLRRAKKHAVLAANKVDDSRTEADASSLWSLGLGEPFPVSALHGRGCGELLDAILDA